MFCSCTKTTTKMCFNSNKKILLFSILLFSSFVRSQSTYSNWLNFNGTDGVVTIQTNNNADFSDTDQITVEAWVKVNDGPDSANAEANWDFIVSRETDWQLFVEYIGGQLYFGARIRQHYHGDWPKVISSPISENTWYHVAFTADSSSSTGQIKMYVNGQQVNYNNYTVRSSSDGLTNTNNDIAIGAFNANANRALNGEVSDVRIWKTVRTESEISSNADQTLSSNSSLLLYYKLNEGSGTTINDSSGNNIDGTLSGAYQWEPVASQATATITSSDSDNLITSGVVTLTATFSENMAATPLVSIAGLVTNTAMTQGADATEWTYYWQVPSSITTGTYAVTVAATDTNSRPYAGSESLDVSIDPMFYLDANGVTVKCKGCSAGDTGYVGNVLYTAHDNTSIFNKSTSDTDWDRVVTTLVTDMSDLFKFTGPDYANRFNQDISSWDTSNVTTFESMFENAIRFNKDISNWDTSKVTNMSGVFEDATAFNQNISSWDTSSVLNMSYMFHGADVFNNGDGLRVANSPLSWDVSNVENMSNMFYRCVWFNQYIGNWDVSKVTDMSSMFYSAWTFNNGTVIDAYGTWVDPIYTMNWDVSSVTTMERMFMDTHAFNNDITAWDVSSVTNMLYFIPGSRLFHQDLSRWCVTQITSRPSYGSNTNAFSYKDGLSSLTGGESPQGNWYNLYSKHPQWGTCPSPTSNATLTISSNDSDNIITSGVVTLTATFSENMAATPLVSIAGLVTNTAMIQGSSAAEWNYYWQVPSSVTTGTFAVTVAATDTSSLAYDGSTSLNLSIDPMFYLDANGVTIKCSGC